MSEDDMNVKDLIMKIMSDKSDAKELMKETLRDGNGEISIIKASIMMIHHLSFISDDKETQMQIASHVLFNWINENIKESKKAEVLAGIANIFFENHNSTFKCVQLN